MSAEARVRLSNEAVKKLLLGEELKLRLLVGGEPQVLTLSVADPKAWKDASTAKFMSDIGFPGFR